MGDTGLPFTVDPVTGQVRTRAPLDRETQQSYTLTVVVTDSSLTQPRSAATNITVLLRDVNDSPPQFSAAEYTVRVPDGAPAGQSTNCAPLDVVLEKHASSRVGIRD